MQNWNREIANLQKVQKSGSWNKLIKFAVYKFELEKKQEIIALEFDFLMKI